MRKLLLLVGGALVGYGIYTALKGCQKKTIPEPVLTPKERVDVFQKTEFIPAPNQMIEHSDARPEVLFAPPKAYVYTSDPAVSDLITPSPDF